MRCCMQPILVWANATRTRAIDKLLAEPDRNARMAAGRS
jgi:hypothetical protein